MTYILFIVFCAGITQFVTVSNIGLFIREHSFLKKNNRRILEIFDQPSITMQETIWDLLHCSMCFGWWCGAFLSLYFEYHGIDLILLKSLFGPTLYAFLSSFSSWILCTLSELFGKWLCSSSK